MITIAEIRKRVAKKYRIVHNGFYYKVQRRTSTFLTLWIPIWVDQCTCYEVKYPQSTLNSSEEAQQHMESLIEEECKDQKYYPIDQIEQE